MLSGWTLKDQQNFITMLNQCETAGVTDIRAVRDRLHESIRATHKEHRIVKSKNRPNKKNTVPLKRCPECPRGVLSPVNTGGEKIAVVECAACRYSEVV